MPKLVFPQLNLNGDDFLSKHGYSARVEMCAGGHSAFRISFSASATETYTGALMENAIEFIGKRISIHLEADAMEYTGLITSIDLQKGTGAAGTLIISGHGPAVLLANSVQCLSYEEGTKLSYVAKSILEGHSSEILKPLMGAGNDIVLPYTVQYNESDLNFLQRLCRRYGLWLYHNGREFCIGRKGNKKIPAIYGTDVTAFNLSTNLRSQGPDVSGRDWVLDDLFETPSSSFRPKSDHPYFNQVKRESDFIFTKNGIYDYSTGQDGYSHQRDMDTATEVTVLGGSTGMVAATGVSEISNLRVADVLSLEGLDFTDPTKKHSFGNYDIVKIIHSFDHSGQYQNHFEAIPADSPHPPYSNGFESSFCPDQRGRVLDNTDPEGLGRVKVQFEWQRGISASTPWIKTSTPYAGQDRGFYFVPEKGEEVLVGFEGGNPEKPYVIGSGFNAKAKSGFADDRNNIKAIRTRSGNTIELNDTDGGEMITINDKAGNSIHINSAECKMVFTSQGDMEFNAKNLRFNVQEDMEVEVGNDKREAIKGKSETTAKITEENISESKKISVGETLEQVSGDLVMQTSKGKMLLEGQGKVSLQSATKVSYGK